MSLFALLVTLMLPTPAPAPLANFDLRLEREGAEWRVSCDNGCAYSRATVTCAVAGCEVIISSRGVQTRRSEFLQTTDFAFVVTPVENGWRATSIHGTAWQALSASCGPRGTCRTRISETGVRVR